jgi:ElaB/YqjD/DUF883 family membrane-anchored ribosome-binding protein
MNAVERLDKIVAEILEDANRVLTEQMVREMEELDTLRDKFNTNMDNLRIDDAIEVYRKSKGRVI